MNGIAGGGIRGDASLRSAPKQANPDGIDNLVNQISSILETQVNSSEKIADRLGGSNPRPISEGCETSAANLTPPIQARLQYMLGQVEQIRRNLDRAQEVIG